MFKVGDKVKWCGVEGEVVNVTADPYFPIDVEFSSVDKIEGFTIDGRVQRWHTEPSLILVERKEEKKWVKKEIDICIPDYPTIKSIKARVEVLDE